MTPSIVIIGQVSQELGDIVMNMTFDFEGLFFLFSIFFK